MPQPRGLLSAARVSVSATLARTAPATTYFAPMFGNTFQGDYKNPGQQFNIDEYLFGDIRDYDEDVAQEADRSGSREGSFKVSHKKYKNQRFTSLEDLVTNGQLRRSFVRDTAGKFAKAIDNQSYGLIRDNEAIRNLGAVDTSGGGGSKALVDKMINAMQYQLEEDDLDEDLICTCPPDFLTDFLNTPGFIATDRGFANLYAGEAGRYRNVRFVTQLRTVDRAAGTGEVILSNGSRGGEKVIDYRVADRPVTDFRYDGEFLRLYAFWGNIISDPNQFVRATVEVDAVQKSTVEWGNTVLPGTQTPWGVVRPQTDSIGAYTAGGSLSGVPGRPAGVVPTPEQLAAEAKGVQDGPTFNAGGSAGGNSGSTSVTIPGEDD